MTVNWSCSTIGIYESGTDKCCYSNSTCADYVCSALGSNVSVVSEVGSPTMYNCFVNASRATELQQDAPNGICNSTSGGSGCLLRSENDTASNSSSTGNGTSAGGDGGNSAALRRFDVLHESWLLGFLILVFMLRKAL
ncbi:hypothetical protein IAU59_001372 [Kwoniella sp. CBS 9459]